MSPEGLITSEFDDAAIIDADIAAPADDLDDLADLEVVVLDLTGTTVVDDGLVERAFERAADAAGIAGMDDELDRAVAFLQASAGRSTIAVFRALSDDEDQAQHAAAVFESAYAELASHGGVRAVAGAEELIRRLRAIGVSVVLTAGLSRATTDAVLAAVGWRGLADLTLTPEDAGRGGPYPDLPLTALLRVGASSVDGMVVVGDATADVAGGLAAGAGLVVGVLTGSDDERALSEAGADAVVASVADLGELLGLEALEGPDALEGLDALEGADRLDDVDDDDDDEYEEYADVDEVTDVDEPDADGADFSDLDALRDAGDVDDLDETGADDRPEGQTLR
ncbi:HAD family hydrolase [uncultured Leifsonia sp.]|uniref:HAD family hydrolase n=1 Tax=uncultured Leifsonia sp. TaxID=340359 RepID=UPI0025E0126C|nr:HAD family hydrolase [uncultured Leifsonia sp.]